MGPTGEQRGTMLPPTSIPLSPPPSALSPIQVKKLLEAAQNNARRLLTQHSAELHALASALLERETLTGQQVKEVMEAARKPAPSPAAAPASSAVPSSASAALLAAGSAVSSASAAAASSAAVAASSAAAAAANVVGGGKAKAGGSKAQQAASS